MNKDESEKTKKVKKTKKKSHIDKGASAKSLILGCLSWVRGLFLKQWKREWIEAIRKEVKEKPCVLILALANLTFVYFNLQSNEREEKLFIGQNIPFINVTPYSITPGESKGGTKMCTTMFRVVNYSGFVAYKIAIDVTYVSNVWISKWLQADHDNKTMEKGIVKGKSFLLASKVVHKKLKPGDPEVYIGYTGELDLEKTVGNAGTEGYPVLVRVTWENKRGHVFDEIHKYKIICTKKDSGRAFNFIPEGIISQKN